MQEILIKTIELEKLLFKVVDFMNKEETVNKYIFKNISNNICCEFDKQNYGFKFYRTKHMKVGLNYLLDNINFNNTI